MIIGLLYFALVGIWTYVQIPAEDPEIIAARKAYGSVRNK